MATGVGAAKLFWAGANSDALAHAASQGIYTETLPIDAARAHRDHGVMEGAVTRALLERTAVTMAQALVPHVQQVGLAPAIVQLVCHVPQAVSRKQEDLALNVRRTPTPPWV